MRILNTILLIVALLVLIASVCVIGIALLEGAMFLMLFGMTCLGVSGWIVLDTIEELGL